MKEKSPVLWLAREQIRTFLLQLYSATCASSAS